MNLSVANRPVPMPGRLLAGLHLVSIAAVWLILWPFMALLVLLNLGLSRMPKAHRPRS